MNKEEIIKPAGSSDADTCRITQGSLPPIPQALERIPGANRATAAQENDERTLRSGRSGLFGMILPDPTNPFFTELLSCFEAVVSKNGQDLIFASTHFDPQQVEACVQRMVRRRVDGIVFAASEMLTTHESLKRYGVPFVTLDRGEVSERISDVSVDFDSAMIDAVQYLQQLGHDRIGFIGGFPGPKVSQTRVQGFREAMKIAGLDLPEAYIREGDFRAEGGAAAMSQFLSLRIRPTAVVSVNDLTALGALQLLQERGISVPREMSIIGFDDIAMSALVYPGLTTFSISKSDMAQMLYDALNHVRDERVKRGSLCKIRAKLIIRDSVAKFNSVRSSTLTL